MTLDTQLLTMISMVIGGVYLGFATETFRRLSVSWKQNKVLTYLLEISYWIIQTCLLFFVLFQVNNGELRVYIFLACLFGFSIYQVLFKEIYKQLLEWIIKVVKAIITGIINIVQTVIIRPIQWIIQLVVAIILYILRICYRLFLFVLKIIFYPFRSLFSYIEKFIPEKIKNIISKSFAFCSTIINKFNKVIKRIIGKRR